MMHRIIRLSLVSSHKNVEQKRLFSRLPSHFLVPYCARTRCLVGLGSPNGLDCRTSQYAFWEVRRVEWGMWKFSVTFFKFFFLSYPSNGIFHDVERIYSFFSYSSINHAMTINLNIITISASKQNWSKLILIKWRHFILL